MGSVAWPEAVSAVTHSCVTLAVSCEVVTGIRDPTSSARGEVRVSVPLQFSITFGELIWAA